MDMHFKPTKMLIIDIPSSTSAAWFDFIKMFVGIGILVIPNAFVNGGLALTSVFLVLITLTYFSGTSLSLKQFKTSFRGTLSYAFSRSMKMQ